MNNTIPNVPRELLAELQEHIHCHHDAVLWGKVCDLLSAPSPAGVYSSDPLACPGCASGCFRCASPAGADGLEVVGWYTEDHLDDKSATTYSREVADRWLAKGWPVNGIANAAAAQAIIDGLRGEVAELRRRAKTAEREAGSALRTYKGLEKVARVVSDNSDQVCGELNVLRQQFDQQAQRIGEMEGLLREVHDTYRAAIHWEDLRGTMKRIDESLSAGKDSVS